MFDRSGEVVEGNLILFTSGSLMTSQARSKSKCLTILRVRLCRALEPYGIEISQYNDMDRVWDTSKHHPKLSMSIFKVKVIQSHHSCHKPMSYLQRSERRLFEKPEPQRFDFA